MNQIYFEYVLTIFHPSLIWTNKACIFQHRPGISRWWSGDPLDPWLTIDKHWTIKNFSQLYYQKSVLLKLENSIEKSFNLKKKTSNFTSLFWKHFTDCLRVWEWDRTVTIRILDTQNPKTCSCLRIVFSLVLGTASVLIFSGMTSYS